MRITNPKLANNSLVNRVVCVIKPGPMADVAIKKAAPKNAPEYFEILFNNLFF